MDGRGGGRRGSERAGGAADENKRKKRRSVKIEFSAEIRKRGLVRDRKKLVLSTLLLRLETEVSNIAGA